MKLVYGERELVFEFYENEVQVVTIENEEYLTAFLQNMYQQSHGAEGKLILSADEKILSLSKCAEIIWNPFSIDINNKKILGKLFQELKNISMEEQYTEISEMNSRVVQYLDELNLKSPYSLQFNLDLDVIDLYKIYGVQLETEGTSIFEKLLEYVKIVESLCGVRLLIFINIKNYLTEIQLNELYKTAFYCKINLLLVEAHQSRCLECENNQLIDQERCLIYY